jgi:hypothetical protein
MLKRTVLLIVAAATMAWGAMAEAQNASELLEKGIYTEETVGDLDAAIKIYEKIVTEDQANRQFVAQAQFRLGKCLAKQGRKEEAQKVFQELVDQFKDSPAQKELVEKARKLVPVKSKLKLDPVTWVDGEHLEMRIKLGSGLDIGAFVFSAKADKEDGRDVWRLALARNITVNAPNLALSQVVADRETFQPIHSLFRHSLLGTFETDYTPGKATVHSTAVDGKETERTTDLDGVYYDNEQGWHLFRRLPLADDYVGKLPIYASFGAGAIELEAEVTGKEAVETPAGKFECYKVLVKPVQQNFWISDDSHRYVVKFEAGGVSGVLQSIRQVRPGDKITQSSDKLGVSLSAPADWYFLPQDVSVGESEKLFVVMDPKAEAASAVHIQPLDSLSGEERKSVRAWAEQELADAAAKTKDHQVREDSWQQRQVGGLPAASYVADFLIGDKKRAEYAVFVLGKSTAVSFNAHTAPDELDDFRKKFDPIIDSYKEE